MSGNSSKLSNGWPRPTWESECGRAGLYLGDCSAVMAGMPERSVQCCVTSPPYYGLRDYGIEGQLGLEKTPEEYVDRLVEVFREVRRVLRDDGVLWLNLGDSYNGSRAATKIIESEIRESTRSESLTGGKIPPQGFAPKVHGLKPKDLVGIPWRVAFALQADGWYLRQDIIWHKPNPMPESVRDRCTKAHEYVFLLAKSARYFYDSDAVAEEMAGSGNGGVFNRASKHSVLGNQSVGKDYRVRSKNTRNRRTVWTVTTKPFNGAHFAVFPPKLIEPCILAGSRPGDIVFDPFCGSGTAGMVALEHGRDFVGIDLSETYLRDIARARIEAALLAHPKDAPAASGGVSA